ncbi:ThuA domain-containing protein [Pseudactinotalea sp. HY158]|uniref:ThuA domain-containing protein n=1 Tax=Pseudactinotalea sp. HY158 TaxID=2654547 RepID=UPI001E5B8A60|nr:ThuA domain-containing protein [Pseudactinotalea sp. HY158]
MSTTPRPPASSPAGRARRLKQAGIFTASAALMATMNVAPAIAGPPGQAEAARSGDAVVTANEEATPTGDVEVLVFHGDPAEQDDPVLEAANTIAELGAANGFSVTSTSDPADFTDENLDGYRGVVFLSAVGSELDGDQEGALEEFINDGGGFLGIRDAAKAQESSQWFTGLVGARPAGIRPTPEEVADVTATGENPPRETAANLTDGDENTKWLAFDDVATVTYELVEPAVITEYAMVSANDFPGRDPGAWTVRGSTDGESWTDLDTRSDDFSQRFLRKSYEIDNSTEYQYFQLEVRENGGESATQLADWLLFTEEAVNPPDVEVPTQEATVNVVDRLHVANEGLPLNWTRSDKWYNWETNPIGRVHTIAQVQEWDYDAGDTANGAFHPISWCRDYDGGRSFYTGMGGTAESYSEDGFRSHLLGAIQWSTGIVRADCQATIGSNYEIERLTTQNSPGELDQIGEPHGLVTTDDGTVFYVGRGACATGAIPSWDAENVGLGCGTIHQWDPDTGEATLLTVLDVFGNRGSGGELVKTEEGLFGIEPDPDFAENDWLYVYWMPYDSIDTENRTGMRTVSRFTYDRENVTIDQDTRVDLLEWQTQIHSCCHAGGGMAFDDDGNLYVSTGDNNSSQGSSGYSGNNWTQEYAGISFQDARRTAGNTNNLNGKILRIHPEEDGTYTIPEGNLFTGEEGGGDKARAEIYVMGVRNPSRIQIDADTDWLTAAWVGPDAFLPDPELGPAKYETATIITSAGNQGWPYCMGNRQPYRDRSNEDASILTDWYDCDDLENNSPRNTGLVDIPDARDNMIWYSPSGGGPDFPRDENGIPSYEEDEATYSEPYLRGGGQAVMSGPTYRSSQVDSGSDIAWPEYWEGKWLIGDQSNPNNRMAITVDPDAVDEAAPPVFAEDLRQIIRAGGGDNQLQSWMDAEFGPDGALYMLDYGSGFFTLHQNQKLIRIVYTGGPATPAPAATATSIQSSPLTVQFNGSRSGGVAWEWDFGDGTTSTEADPRHTYDRVDSYEATLTVTYADGTVETVGTDAVIECAVPDSRDTVWIGDEDTGVTNTDLGGCTIADLIDDEGEWDNHGAFIRHVNDVIRQLRDNDVISGRDIGRLTNGAARSDVGTPGDAGYRWLFDGTSASLDGWRQAPGGHFELLPGGSLLSQGGLGMLWYEAEEFEDFSLKLQFRDVSEGTTYANSGVFVRFPDPTAQDQPECGRGQSQAWVAISCGHEIQLYDGPTGEPQKTGSVYNFEPVAREDAGLTEKGVWNDYEIRVVDQHYTIVRNGVVINEFENAPGKESSRAGDPPTDLRQFERGFIGLQNHSNSDRMEFRNIRVQDLS